ncbi:MAG: ATPase domain-containing protein [Candidatus Micrarchaeota archaeon]
MAGKKKVAEKSGDSRTGIAELDAALGGGFPRHSVILLSGPSGSGKTILCFQWLFQGVRDGEGAIYISVTEPLFKSLKNLESMEFYAPDAVSSGKLGIIDLRELYGSHGFDPEKVLNFIEKEVWRTKAKRLVIDSVSAISYALADRAKIRKFIFELGKMLASLGCTSVLVSEVSDGEQHSVFGVEEFISDGIVRLEQRKVRGESERSIHVVKVRGRAHETRDIHFKVTRSGITAFPHVSVRLGYQTLTERVSTGMPDLDAMLDGGVFRGSTTMVIGPTGTGKTISCMQFLVEGLKAGEPCLFAGFEEGREEILRNSKALGWDLGRFERSGLLSFRCVSPAEMSAEEHLSEISRAVESGGIRRCAVDSLSSVANSYDDETSAGFSKRLNSFFKSRQVTALVVVETPALIGTGSLADTRLSVVTDNVISYYHVEMEGQLNMVLNILKARGSAHSKVLRLYEISDGGISLGQSLSGYEGVMTGVTRKVSRTIAEQLEAEFTRFIGPMGAQSFRALSEKGLSLEAADDYIDSLVRDGMLKREDGAEFKARCAAILAGEGKKPGGGTSREKREPGIIGKILGE